MDVEGRVALVTGASRGIGAAAAERLAAAGADVAVGYGSDLSASEEVAEAVRRAGRRAVAVGGDVSDPAAVEEMASAAEGALGSVDVLVSNAGIAPLRKLEEIPVEEWARVVGVNVRSAFLLAHGRPASEGLGTP